MRDFIQNPEDRVIRRCEVCRVDAVLKPELVQRWDENHAHGDSDE